MAAGVRPPCSAARAHARTAHHGRRQPRSARPLLPSSRDARCGRREGAAKPPSRRAAGAASRRGGAPRRGGLGRPSSPARTGTGQLRAWSFAGKRVRSAAMGWGGRREPRLRGGAAAGGAASGRHGEAGPLPPPRACGGSGVVLLLLRFRAAAQWLQMARAAASGGEVGPARAVANERYRSIFGARTAALYGSAVFTECRCGCFALNGNAKPGSTRFTEPAADSLSTHGPGRCSSSSRLNFVSILFPPGTAYSSW